MYGCTTSLWMRRRAGTSPMPNGSSPAFTSRRCASNPLNVNIRPNLIEMAVNSSSSAAAYMIRIMHVHMASRRIRLCERGPEVTVDEDVSEGSICVCAESYRRSTAFGHWRALRAVTAPVRAAGDAPIAMNLQHERYGDGQLEGNCSPV